MAEVLAPGRKKLYEPFQPLYNLLGFATMPSGKYYQDKFGAFYISHRIPLHFKSFGQNNFPALIWVYRLIGGFQKIRIPPDKVLKH